jgi:hypothetical protein
MPSLPPARVLPLIAAGALLAAVAASPARADTVLFINGNILYGEVEGADVSIVTPTGTVQATRADLADLTLGTLHGDVLHYRNGSAVMGLADRASYAVRLPSGQTVTVERGLVDVIRFSR